VIVQAGDQGFVLQPSGATYTMTGDDIPFFLVHLNHQAANLTVEVFDVATGRSMNLAEEDELLPRNSTATSLFLFAWDGTTLKKAGGKLTTLPNGTYRIELSVLKAGGDPRNPAHFERWTSPNISIARP